MKKKLLVKNIIWVIATVALTFFLVESAGHLLDPFEAEDGLDAIKAFHNQEENSIDVIVYGSSRAWKGCDSRIMWDEYGIKAYNYGCNWQAINTTLLFIQDSFRTQSPKVIFVETGHVGLVLEDTDLTGEIYYTREMSNFEGKRKYLNQCFGQNVERYASYYVPLIMFHDNWSEVDFENFYAPGPERYMKNWGYSDDCNTVVETGTVPNISEVKQLVLPNKSIEILDEIVSECAENNTRVVFFTTPCFNGYGYADAMEEYAISRNVGYLNIYDYMDEIGMSGTTDFQDFIHLNKSGAEKVARFLAEYVTSVSND